LLWAESNLKDKRSKNPIIEFLKRLFINGCKAFIVPGRSSQEYLIAYGVPPRLVFKAPNAVDNDLFAAGAAAARRDAEKQRAALHLPTRYFLFVGRLIREKGIFDLLDAYASLEEVTRANVALVFVGEGPERDELGSRAANISPGSIRVAGFTQREQLAAYYGLAEALIFPTYSDPWGLVVNEAMVCGLPIICTEVAGCVADLVCSGHNGLVTKPGDVAALTSALQELADPVRLKQMGAASVAKIQEYSPAAWAAGIKRAIEFAEGSHAN
jgi:glycosyltransferase involved in cell wall biosynthesis